MKQPWFRFQAKAETPDVAEIHVQGVIWPNKWDDGDVTAVDFVRQLSQLPEAVKNIKVHINSPGGDVATALNIANALRDQKVTKGRNVETIVDGIAASAATIIMMGGQKVTVADNSITMIHNPYNIEIGNAAELRKAADVLDSIRGAIIATYQWHSPLSSDELAALMDAESWMSADEAIAAGLATDKVSGMTAAALLEPEHMAAAKLKVPERFAAAVAALTRTEAADPEPAPAAPPVPATPAAATIAEVFPAVRAAGLDVEFAAQLVERGVAATDVTTLVAAETARRAAEAQRVEGIRDLGTKFKQVAVLVDDFVSGGVNFETARSITAKVRALVDKAEIDAGLSPDGPGNGKAAVLDVMAIYRERNSKPVAH